MCQVRRYTKLHDAVDMVLISRCMPKHYIAIHNSRKISRTKKSNQVNVRFEPEFYERLKEACSLQEHAEGQLVRILTEWALPFYEQCGSVKDLKHLYPFKQTNQAQRPEEKIKEIK